MPTLENRTCMLLGTACDQLTAELTRADSPETPRSQHARRSDGQLDVPNIPVGGTLIIRSLTAGWRHVCAVTNAAIAPVTCWGRGEDGQSRVPAGLYSIDAVALGATHSCALSRTAQIVTNQVRSAAPAQLLDLMNYICRNVNLHVLTQFSRGRGRDIAGCCRSWPWRVQRHSFRSL